jgi:ribosome modulation factor
MRLSYLCMRFQRFQHCKVSPKLPVLPSTVSAAVCVCHAAASKSTGSSKAKRKSSITNPWCVEVLPHVAACCLPQQHQHESVGRAAALAAPSSAYCFYTSSSQRSRWCSGFASILMMSASAWATGLGFRLRTLQPLVTFHCHHHHSRGRRLLHRHRSQSQYLMSQSFVSLTPQSLLHRPRRRIHLR